MWYILLHWILRMLSRKALTLFFFNIIQELCTYKTYTASNINYYYTNQLRTFVVSQFLLKLLREFVNFLNTYFDWDSDFWFNIFVKKYSTIIFILDRVVVVIWKWADNIFSITIYICSFIQENIHFDGLFHTFVFIINVIEKT